MHRTGGWYRSALCGRVADGCLVEFAHQPRILDARSALDSGGNVNHVGSQNPYRCTHIPWVEPARKNDFGTATVACKIHRQRIPRQRDAGTTEFFPRVGVKEYAIGSLEQIVELVGDM